MEDRRELENYFARVSKDRIIAAVAEAASADGSNGIPQKDWPVRSGVLSGILPNVAACLYSIAGFHEQSRSDKGQWLG